MERQRPNRIFAENDPPAFVGRAAELERVLAHSAVGGQGRGLTVLASPGSGASELLRQAHARLFSAQQNVIPFYFEFRPTDISVDAAASRFLYQFLLQTVAFRRAEPQLMETRPGSHELIRLASDEGATWAERLVDGAGQHSDVSDRLQTCFGAPVSACAGGMASTVFIDGLHYAEDLGDGLLIERLCEIYGKADISFVFAGHRRLLFARTPFPTLRLEPLSFPAAAGLVSSVSERTGVAITDGSRDLMAVQLGGNALSITSLFAAAADNGSDLKTFEQVQQIYTEEIFGGRLSKRFDEVLKSACRGVANETSVIRLLGETVDAEGGARLPITYWEKSLDVSDGGLERLLHRLHTREIINAGAGSAGVDNDDHVLCDVIRARKLLETDGASRALTVGATLAGNIRRAPGLMARFYRRSRSIGLRELMRWFDGRRVSSALLDQARFNDEFRGAADDKVIKALKDDSEVVELPRIVYTAHTSAFYPMLDSLCDRERSAVAMGFSGHGEANEIVWIAAQIDSKLEATRELAGFWCDRLEMAAVNCNFPNFKIWLIAPEGFDKDAMELLRERNACGTSRRQVELLSQILNAPLPSAERSADEYEIVVPMGEDTEMIAAHTIEEIARRHHFPTKAINQIKTALVEACINAAEHSLSPDRRIHQRFAVGPGRITITVSNRGIRFVPEKVADHAPSTGRRGWGLKLIKGLMDEVDLEQTDDGTRLTMTKFVETA